MFEDFSIIVFIPYPLSVLTAYCRISKTDEVKSITADETPRYTHGLIIILCIITVLIMALNMCNFVGFMLYIFSMPMVVIFPFSVVFVLQSYNLTKAVIYVAVIEIIVF
jgi:hypothetical protein